MYLSALVLNNDFKRDTEEQMCVMSRKVKLLKYWFSSKTYLKYVQV